MHDSKKLNVLVVFLDYCNDKNDIIVPELIFIRRIVIVYGDGRSDNF